MTQALRVLSLIPPMAQLNTPYPSTAYLTGFLRSRGVAAFQEDLALGLVLALFTPEGLDSLREVAQAKVAAADEQASASARSGQAGQAGDAKLKAKQFSRPSSKATAKPNKAPALPQTRHFLAEFAAYRATIGPVIRFLQGADSTLMHRINARGFLPEGARFATLEHYAVDDSGEALLWAFGSLGAADKAKHLATLYLNDLADVLREAVDPRFEFVRYAEQLAAAQADFSPLANALAEPPNLLDSTLARLTREALAQHQPDVVLLSVPFPGSVYGALRIAQTIKAEAPKITVVLGGGYVNTELRELAEPRLFDFVDFVTLDGGERPLLALLDHLQGQRSRERLVRTFVRETSPDGTAQVKLIRFPEPDIPFDQAGTPTWDGLPLGRYLSLLDMLNPMHRLWSDGRWNKLTVAHGCYWKKCSFCDVSLDYISRYEAASAEVLVQRIQTIVAETGQTGFHFVDEAAPPKALKALAQELRRQNTQISWWGNIRFEKTFTPELALELADSGCIAVTGGLEVASDRLLNLMKKGVSVEQVARVTKAFADAGILVHAYLMYGFPTQTVQDTVDALEYVRQLFANGCIHSGFFHRFACTVHSPVGLNPEEFGVRLKPLPPGNFARNDVGFIDTTLDQSGTSHDELGAGLKKAIYNFMHGIGLEEDVRSWFSHLKCPVPRPTVGRQRIAKALAAG